MSKTSRDDIAAPTAPVAVPEEVLRLSEKATEGPWIFERIGPACGLYSDDKTGSIIARFNGFEHAPRPTGEQDANAALSAAAVNFVRSLASGLGAPVSALTSPRPVVPEEVRRVLTRSLDLLTGMRDTDGGWAGDAYGSQVIEEIGTLLSATPTPDTQPVRPSKAEG